MTSIPASRSARAMILAPRSCPSRPGLATTTRIFWLVLGADIGRGRGILCAERRRGPEGPRDRSSCRPPLPDRELERHAGMDLADDRVRALGVELLQDRA